MATRFGRVDLSSGRWTGRPGLYLVCLLLAVALSAGAAQAASVVPTEIGVLVEQLPQTTSVMISTRFSQIGVQPAIGQVWYDGTDYVVDVDFQASAGGSGSEGWLVWSTLGRPEVGTHRVSIRHQSLGRILVTQLFTTLPVGQLATQQNVELTFGQLLGDYEFDPVGPEVYPWVRSVVPSCMGQIAHQSLGAPGPELGEKAVVVQPPIQPVPRPFAGDCHYPLRWRFGVANDQATPLSSVALTLTPPAALKLSQTSFQLPSLAAGSSTGFELDVKAVGSASSPTVGFALSWTNANGSAGQINGNLPVSILQTGRAVGTDDVRTNGKAPLASRPGDYSFDWTASDFEWGGDVGVFLPTDDHYTVDNLNLPPGELQQHVGVPTVIIQSLGGAVIGGVAKAAYDLVKEGETSVGSVLGGAVAGAITADIGPALKVGQAIVKGVQAVVGFFSKLFSGPERILYGQTFVFEDVYYDGTSITATLLDGSTETYKFIGRGDPMPRSMLGSNVIQTSSLQLPHYASCAAGTDLRFDEAEITRAAWSWARAEDRTGCGVPSDDALLDAMTAWVRKQPATALDRGPAAGPPAADGLTLEAAQPSQTRLRPGGTLQLHLPVTAVATTQGVLLDLVLPTGWKLAVLERAGGFFQLQGKKLLWLELPPGRSEVVLKVGVPDTAVAGTYEIGARLRTTAHEGGASETGAGGQAQETVVSLEVAGTVPRAPARQ